MSESIYESGNNLGDPDVDLDLDESFGSDAVDETVYEASYSPPEKPKGVDQFGTTLAEQQEGETLDQRLAQEIPDPNLAPDLTASASDENLDSVDNSRIDDEELTFGEVGRERAGRLVDPDQGLGPDVEKDLVGDDVGIDEGAASAEEAAVHIIE